jgi:serine/threonine-protein kinase
VWDTPVKLDPLFEPMVHPIIELEQPGKGAQRFDLREGPVVMGRHEACQCVVASPRMSRLHAAIYTHRGRLWIADLQSQNGTQYQGRQLTPGVPIPLRVDGEDAPIRLYDQELVLRTLPS